MTKGRNTSVISVRLPDEIVKRLKAKTRKTRQSLTELLKPVITDFAYDGNIPRFVYKVDPAHDEPEDSPELEPDHLKRSH